MIKTQGKILIVDDDNDILLTGKIILKKYFSEIQTCNKVEKIPELLKNEQIDIVLLDMNFTTGATSGKERLYWLQKIRKDFPNCSVIMSTAYADVDIAVEALKKGATDFIVKPWSKQKLVATLHSAMQLASSKKTIKNLEAKQDTLLKDLTILKTDFIGQSSAMKLIFNQIKKVAKTDANVLILGENGTGKELVAQSIHKNSYRFEQPLIKVDLGSIPETLFESELFGHVKGAYTDARTDRAGKFEIASGGSLFLDEIGILPISMQSKLLSVIQDEEFYRLGSNKKIKTDIRLICATNILYDELSTENRFRQDLLYRINTIIIHLPPLRERKDDIPLLSEYFIRKYAKKYKKAGAKLSKEAIKKLQQYNWPGNIRELEHLIEHSLIMCENTLLKAEDILINTAKINKTNDDLLNLEQIEKKAINKALIKVAGNLSEAAKILGIGRTTLYRKLEKYGS